MSAAASSSLLSQSPLSLTQPLSMPTTAVGAHASPQKIAATAKTFEASFLSSMLGAMFEGLSTAPPFGGGEAEEAFRSFYTDALSKEIVHHGGIGLAKHVQAEMLKMQGLSPASSAPTAAAPKISSSLSPALRQGLATYQGTVQ